MTVEDLCGKATNKEMLRVETGNTQPQYFDQMKNSSDFLDEKIKKNKGISLIKFVPRRF